MKLDGVPKTIENSFTGHISNMNRIVGQNDSRPMIPHNSLMFPLSTLVDFVGLAHFPEDTNITLQEFSKTVTTLNQRVASSMIGEVVALPAEVIAFSSYEHAEKVELIQHYIELAYEKSLLLGTKYSIAHDVSSRLLATANRYSGHSFRARTARLSSDVYKPYTLRSIISTRLHS